MLRGKTLSPYVIQSVFVVLVLSGCAGKTHLDRVATSIAQYGTMSVSAPILLDVEQNDTFSFDLDKPATFYYDAPRVEGAVRLFTQQSIDVQMATKVQLEELASAVAGLNAATVPADIAAAKEKITKVATTLGAINQFAPGGGGAAGIMSNPALQAGMSFLMDSLEKQGAATEPPAPPAGTPAPTVPEATEGEQGEFFSVLPFAKRPAQDVLNSPKFSNPLDRYSGEVTISPRQALSLASNDKMSQDLLKFLAKPKGFGDNKKVYFCIMTVACQPGFVTRTGYAGDVLVSMEYGRTGAASEGKELLDSLASLSVIVSSIRRAEESPDEVKAYIEMYKTRVHGLYEKLEEYAKMRAERPQIAASVDVFVKRNNYLLDSIETSRDEVDDASTRVSASPDPDLSGLSAFTQEAIVSANIYEIVNDTSLSFSQKKEASKDALTKGIGDKFAGTASGLIDTVRISVGSPTGGGLVARQAWGDTNVSSHKENATRFGSSKTEFPGANFPYEDSFPRPLVTGVYPMVDGQVLDLRSSLREQMAMASALALSGFGIQSESMIDAVERIEQDAQTESVFTVGSSYSANGYNFGFRVEPRFVALNDPSSTRSRPGYRLESIQFPAMVLIFADEKALSTEVGGDGGDYDHIVFHTEQRWTPLFDLHHGDPYTIQGATEKSIKRLFVKPHKSEDAMLRRAHELDEVKWALEDPNSSAANEYARYKTNDELGELVKSTLYRRRAALAATGLGSSIFVKLPSYPGPEKNDFTIETKSAKYTGWKNAVSIFPVTGKGLSTKNVVGAVVGGRDAAVRVLSKGTAVIVVDMWGTDTEATSAEVQLLTSSGIVDVGTASFTSTFETAKPEFNPRVTLERDSGGRIIGITTQGTWQRASDLLNALDDVLEANAVSGQKQGINMNISGGDLDFEPHP